jgi:hypothetical protein
MSGLRWEDGEDGVEFDEVVFKAFINDGLDYYFIFPSKDNAELYCLALIREDDDDLILISYEAGEGVPLEEAKRVAEAHYAMVMAS